jgi:hypothetical protein
VDRPGRQQLLTLPPLPLPAGLRHRQPGRVLVRLAKQQTIRLVRAAPIVTSNASGMPFTSPAIH